MIKILEWSDKGEIINKNNDILLENKKEDSSKMLLKYKDFDLLELDGINIIRVFEENIKYLPLELRGNLNINSIYSWIKSRSFQPDRKYYKYIMNKLDIDYISITGILFATLGLSLTDSYWIKIHRYKNAKWSDINLFDNNFSKAIVYLSFTGNSNELIIESDYKTPELNTQGIYSKCWKREEDGIYLYKKDNDNYESYREVLASKLLQNMNFHNINVINYDLVKYEGYTSSKCKLMTTKDISIIPANSYKIQLTNNNIDFNKVLMKYYKEPYEELIFMNAIINNGDLHYYNWGFYFDGIKPLNIHDAMDFNNSIDLKNEGEIRLYNNRKSCFDIAKLLLIHKDYYTKNIENGIKFLSELNEDNKFIEYMYNRLNKLIKEMR